MKNSLELKIVEKLNMNEKDFVSVFRKKYTMFPSKKLSNVYKYYINRFRFLSLSTGMFRGNGCISVETDKKQFFFCLSF